MNRVLHGRCVSFAQGRKHGSPRTSRAWSQSVTFLLFALLSSVYAPADWAQAEAPSEYQLKAAFLFNFAKFIEWPGTSFATPQSPFTICILGTDPFGNVMDDALQGKTVGGRSVAVERSKDLADARHCQIVFVSSAEHRRLPQILSGLHGTHALVVGETEGFAAGGGIIQFSLENDRVHFLINTDAADRAGLKVSSKLLSLAQIVHDAAKDGGG